MASEQIQPKRKVALIAIDGWGVSSQQRGNAIIAAEPTYMNKFKQAQQQSSNNSDDPIVSETLWGELDAHGLAVGLPRGIMGNSEVGHLTMGAGRVQYQDLVKINLNIEQKQFATNPVLRKAFDYAKQHNSRVHFLGLVSDGSVHSHIDHLKQFLDAAKQYGVPRAFVHFFADGRDTPPTSAVQYVKDLLNYLQSSQYGEIGTMMGRYYAMDRDQRWERVRIAYDALVEAKGQHINDSSLLVETVQARYEAKETDEFLKPIIVNAQSKIESKDVMIFINFRADRMREIVQVFGVKPPFEVSTPVPPDVQVIQMTQYNKEFPLPILFPPQEMDNVLGEWLSKHHVRQFHTAETEKYAHVTFFFNGGREEAFALEERRLVPSPKVPTYDHKPDMSVDAVADSVVEAIGTGNYPFVMCNFAPPDMVGHTGRWEPAIEAVKATDDAIAKIHTACKKHGYVLVISADHGNAEEMLDEKGEPKTSHTTNDVPLVITGDAVKNDKLRLNRSHGGLCDVAPTILHLMGLPIPPQMTGKSMLE